MTISRAAVAIAAAALLLGLTAGQAAADPAGTDVRGVEDVHTDILGLGNDGN